MDILAKLEKILSSERSHSQHIYLCKKKNDNQDVKINATAILLLV